MRLPNLLLVALSLALPSPTANAQVTTRLVGDGVTRPLWAGAPRGDARLFVVLKDGPIRIIENGAFLPAPFLDLSSQLATGGEQGLLGLAFHPNYSSNGFFYVNYTRLGGRTVVARFSVTTTDRNRADPTSEFVLLRVLQPFSNHNGGDLHFGPDGYLYIFLGDGGFVDDPDCRAQDLALPLGKILRIDVDGGSPYTIPPDNPFVGVPGALEEIFHYGLRNPWRNAFDSLTGDLFIGDVGQDRREEIDVAPAGSAGLNFGWKIMEGTLCNLTTSCVHPLPCNDPALVLPIAQLTHLSGSFSITGGRVYRGCAIPSEQGNYFYADYVDGRIRSLEYDRLTGTALHLRDRTAELASGGSTSFTNVASFGEDGFGELLIVETRPAGLGRIFKMVPEPATQALGTLRNGSGVNRLCLSERSLPIAGNRWELRVDSSGHPGAMTTIVAGFAAASGGVHVNGSEVLVNCSSPLYYRQMRPASGGLDAFDIDVPCEPALIGLTLSMQAWIVGGGVELCNAIDARVGY